MTAALSYSPALRRSFLSEIDALSGQQVELCYHCHTCSAGCLVSEAMAHGPDRMLRLIELGERARALAAPDIWLCVGCETCSARCPNGIDVARVMDTLRHLSLAQPASRETRRLRLFHDIYMQVVRYTGRLSEALMLGLYKVLGLDLFSDLGAGLQLVLRGKIPIIPERIRQQNQIERLFAGARKADQREQAAARSGEGRLP
jgi:heterodisulfide reductase subunit C